MIPPPDASAARLVTDAERSCWDDFVRSTPQAHFCQAWGFGAARAEAGYQRQVWVVEREGIWQAGALMLHLRWPGVPWSLAYLPRGPVWLPTARREDIASLLAQLAASGRTWGACALHADTGMSQEDAPLLAPLRTLGLADASWDASPLGTQPRAVFRVDLARPEEEILASFHRMKRRCLRTAQRQGVEISQDRDQEGLSVFLELHRRTLARQRYLRLPERYFHALQREWVEPGLARYWIARHQGRPCAAILTCDFGPGSWYLYGGFDYRARALMAPHLLMWEAMRTARREGRRFFDLRGTGAGPGETMSEAHPLHGIHRFKAQFAPHELVFATPLERPLRPLSFAALKAAAPALRLGARLLKTVSAWRYGDGGAGSGND